MKTELLEHLIRRCVNEVLDQIDSDRIKSSRKPSVRVQSTELDPKSRALIKKMVQEVLIRR